jgi:hypothetical protein
MPIPKRKQAEAEDTFISRCAEQLVGEEGYDRDQAVAICYQQLDVQLALDPAWRKSFLNPTSTFLKNMKDSATKIK